MVWAYLITAISFFTLTYHKFDLAHTIIISLLIGYTTILIQVFIDLFRK